MLWDSFLCASMKGMFGVPSSVVYRGVSVINLEQTGAKNRQPPPPRTGMQWFKCKTTLYFGD